MKVSQVIKSIKVNPSGWALVHNEANGIIFKYNDYYFCRHKNGIKGFRIKSIANNVDMFYAETDVVGRQLCMYLVNSFNKK